MSQSAVRRRGEIPQFLCWKIEQNYISSCSLLIITYESIPKFSYDRLFFMQIRLKKILLAVLPVMAAVAVRKKVVSVVHYVFVFSHCNFLFVRSN